MESCVVIVYTQDTLNISCKQAWKMHRVFINVSFFRKLIWLFLGTSQISCIFSAFTVLFWVIVVTDFESESQAFNYSGKSVSYQCKIAIQICSEKSHCLQIDSERRSLSASEQHVKIVPQARLSSLFTFRAIIGKKFRTYWSLFKVRDFTTFALIQEPNCWANRRLQSLRMRTVLRINLPAGTIRLRSVNISISGRVGYENCILESEIFPIRWLSGFRPWSTGMSGLLSINSNNRVEEPRPVIFNIAVVLWCDYF